MIIVGLCIAVVLIALTVAAVLGRIDGSLREPTSTLAYLPLPEDRLTPDDLAALRLDTALRGYRMEQVDQVIGRLAAEIAQLREQVAASSDGVGMPPPAAPAAPDASPFARPDEAAPRESAAGESHPGQSQPGPSQPGPSQPGQSQPGQSQPGEAAPTSPEPELPVGLPPRRLDPDGPAHPRRPPD